jgi:hypothetical protein
MVFAVSFFTHRRMNWTALARLTDVFTIPELRRSPDDVLNRARLRSQEWTATTRVITLRSQRSAQP